MRREYRKVTNKITTKEITQRKANKFTILSIDGGGIRTYMALLFLF